MTGRAARLPLRVSGHGRGADVQLSLDSLDIGAVFKNSVFNYEVSPPLQVVKSAVYAFSLSVFCHAIVFCHAFVFWLNRR